MRKSTKTDNTNILPEISDQHKLKDISQINTEIKSRTTSIQSQLNRKQLGSESSDLPVSAAGYSSGNRNAASGAYAKKMHTSDVMDMFGFPSEVTSPEQVSLPMTSNTRMAGHNKSFQAPLDNASIADLSKRNMFVNFTSELGPDIRNNKRTSHNDHRKLSWL